MPTILPAWFIKSTDDKLAKSFDVTEGEFEKMKRGLMVMLYCNEQHEATKRRYRGNHDIINSKAILRPIAYIS